MTNARRPSREVLLTAVRRFWVVALVAGLAAGIATAALVRSTASTTWSGEATYVVQIADPPVVTALGTVPAADPRLPNDTVDAVRFAAIYSLLLVEDGAVLDVLAEQTGLTAGEVVEQTEALSVPDSPIVRVSFSADSEETVQDFYTGLDRVLSERPALTTTIRPGTLEPLRAAEVTSSSGFGPLALVLGVVVGLGVGLGGALLLERADPRLRSAADVRELAAWPVLTLPQDDDDPRVLVLVQRVVNASRSVHSVAVVGVAGTSTAVLDEAAARLQDVHDRLVGGPLRHHEVDGATRVRPPHVEWVSGGELTQDGAAESLAQQVDAVVLLAPVGARLSRLDGAVTTLEDLAVEAVVVALVPRPTRTRATRAPAATGAPVVEDPVHWTLEDEAAAPTATSTAPDQSSEQTYEQGRDQVSPHR